MKETTSARPTNVTLGLPCREESVAPCTFAWIGGEWEVDLQIAWSYKIPLRWAPAGVYMPELPQLISKDVWLKRFASRLLEFRPSTSRLTRWSLPPRRILKTPFWRRERQLACIFSERASEASARMGHRLRQIHGPDAPSEHRNPDRMTGDDPNAAEGTLGPRFLDALDVVAAPHTFANCG